MDSSSAQLLNGLGLRVLLFSSRRPGLSLIFGLMTWSARATALFFMLGAFFGLFHFPLHRQLLARLALAPFRAALGVPAMEFLFMRPLYRRRPQHGTSVGV